MNINSIDPPGTLLIAALRYSILLLALMLGLAQTSTAQNNNNTLDTSNIEVIRVLLFQLDKPQHLRVGARDGNIKLRTNDGFEITIEEGNSLADIRRNGNQVSISYGNTRRNARSVEVLTDEIGVMRIVHPTIGWRNYRGNLAIDVQNQRLRVINHVELEDYVGSVVGGEMSFHHPEALKTQAVMSRTYALWNVSLFGQDDYELTDHVMNQVYIGEHTDRPRFTRAAFATKGEVLTWSGRLMLAAYHSTCGGATSDNEMVWLGNPLPYLRNIQDGDACEASPHHRWEFQASAQELHRLVQNHTGNRVTRLEPGETDEGGRIRNMKIFNNQQENELSANEFRLLVNRQFGSTSLRSTAFNMQRNGDFYIFNGRGLGHGVGLCQWGALGLAESGWNYRDILRFYFRGSEIVDYFGLEEYILQLAR